MPMAINTKSVKPNKSDSLFSASLHESDYFSSTFQGCKSIKCQSSTTLKFHSPGSTVAHVVIRRKLLFPFVTQLWFKKKKALYAPIFHKIHMKITFCVCVLIEVLFFARLTGGILSWVKKASLLFIFPCFVLYPTLLCRCWVCLCVYILGASLLRGSPESHRMLPESGHLSMSSHQGN